MYQFAILKICNTKGLCRSEARSAVSTGHI